MFSCEFYEIFKNNVFYRTPLFLNIPGAFKSFASSL